MAGGWCGFGESSSHSQLQSVKNEQHHCSIFVLSSRKRAMSERAGKAVGGWFGFASLASLTSPLCSFYCRLKRPIEPHLHFSTHSLPPSPSTHTHTHTKKKENNWKQTLASHCSLTYSFFTFLSNSRFIIKNRIYSYHSTKHMCKNTYKRKYKFHLSVSTTQLLRHRFPLNRYTNIHSAIRVSNSLKNLIFFLQIYLCLKREEKSF